MSVRPRRHNRSDRRSQNAEQGPNDVNYQPVSSSRIQQDYEDDFTTESGEHSGPEIIQPYSETPLQSAVCTDSIPLYENSLSSGGHAPLNDGDHRITASQRPQSSDQEHLEDDDTHWHDPDVPPRPNGQRMAGQDSQIHCALSADATYGVARGSIPRPHLTHRPSGFIQNRKPSSLTRPRANFRKIMEPLGGEPGSITAVQQIFVSTLLGCLAPEWMSDRQASVLLSARSCCEDILRGVTGSHGEADPVALLRLTLAVTADRAVCGQAVKWEAMKTLDQHGNPVYRNRDPEIVRRIENCARKILRELNDDEEDQTTSFESPKEGRVHRDIIRLHTPD